MGSYTVIQTVAPLAQKLWQEGSHIFPSVRVAQCLHETGATLHPWNNLVGMKAIGPPNPFWSGSFVVKGTWEVVHGLCEDVDASFRAYDSIEQCLRDHDRLLRTDNYKPVWDAKDPEAQCWALQDCGYATDPKYADKLIINWLRPMGLRRLDLPRERPKMKGVGKPMQLDQSEWQALYEALNTMYQDSVGGSMLPVSNDYTYAAKAADQVLNSDELLVLLTTVVAKSLANKGA